MNKKFGLFEMGLFAVGAGLSTAIYFPAALVSAYSLVFAGSIGVAAHLTFKSPFDGVFKSVGLGNGENYPTKIGKKKACGCTVYEFTLPAGYSTDDVEKYKYAIEQHIGKEIDVTYGFRNFYIKVYDEKMRTRYDYDPRKFKSPVEVPIGYDREGKLLTVDLSSGEPHMLIAGESGSGKSTEMRSIITSLITNNKADLFLIDLKHGVEFNMFRKCKRVSVLARTATEAESMLCEIIEEVNRRYNLMLEADCTDIKEYNKKVGSLRYQVLVVDEFAAFGKKNKKCFEMLETLSAQARACGIHLIIATQRPSADVINGVIKANITNIVGLKTKDNTNSRVVLDACGLEKLRGQGQGILKRGAEEILFQGPYLSPDLAKELVSPFEVEKRPEKKQEFVELKDFSFLDVI